MTCRDTKNLLNAYVDGELDSAGSLAVETHMRGCASCLADGEDLHGLAAAIENASLRFRVPARLNRNVRAAIRAANPEARSFLFYWRWVIVLASAVLIIAVTWAGTAHWAKSSEETLLLNDIVSSHIRSMMASHVTDVSSSDSYSVGSWFSGKLDYSPPAKDLTEQGFRFIGCRLDYLEKQPVAALVYQRSRQLINLFVWPSDSSAFRGPQQLSRQGYNMIHWTRSGMTYWLISELNLTELNECARLLKE